MILQQVDRCMSARGVNYGPAQVKSRGGENAAHRHGQMVSRDHGVAIITSVALMMTDTVSPSLSARRSREVSVMAAVTGPGSTSTVTSAMTAPDFTDLTVPLS